MNGSGELGVRRRLTIRASELGSARGVRHCKAEADGRGRSFCLFRRGPTRCFFKPDARPIGHSMVFDQYRCPSLPTYVRPARRQ